MSDMEKEVTLVFGFSMLQGGIDRHIRDLIGWNGVCYVTLDCLIGEFRVTVNTDEAFNQVRNFAGDWNLVFKEVRG